MSCSKQQSYIQLDNHAYSNKFKCICMNYYAWLVSRGQTLFSRKGVIAFSISAPRENRVWPSETICMASQLLRLIYVRIARLLQGCEV